MTPEELLALQQLMNGGASVPVDIPQPNVPAPTPPPGYEYGKQADSFNKQADALEKQASTPAPQPKGVSQNLVAAARAFMEGMTRPQDPFYMEKQRGEDQQQAQKTLLERAKEARQSAYQQQNLGETAQLRDVQAQTEKRLATTPHVENISSPRAAVVLPGQDPKFVDTGFHNPTQEETSDIKEYNYAVGQGYKGTFEQWQKDSANFKNPSGNDMQLVQGKLGPDGQPTYVRVKKNGPEGVVNIDGQVLGSKPAEAVAAQKTQANAAKNTKDMIAVVRDITSKNPGLTGPAVGRVADYMLKFGGDPGGIIAAANGMPEGYEKTTALLAGHLAYLFMNEARAALPGNRPPKEYMDFIKSRSAMMSQNPQVMEGFLQSAENNANIALQNAASAGYDPYHINQQPAAGGQQGGVAPEGTVIHDGKGNTLVKRGGKWVAK